MATVAALLIATTAFVGSASAAPTTTKKTFSSATQVPIPDWTPHVDPSNGVGDSPIEVTGVLGNITKVTASVHVSHGSMSDLDAAVIGPDGSTYTYLFNSGALGGANLGTTCDDADRTTFDDAAGTPIDAGAAPYVGSFQTMNIFGGGPIPFSVFNGNAAGTDGIWTFDVFDSVPGNAGTIDCWSLFIETDASQSLRFDSAGPAAIGDAIAESGGPGIAGSSIMATGLPGGISNVTASVYITHAQDSDLDVILQSPTGQQVKLAARVGGTGNNFGTSCAKPTVFDSAAKASISTGTAPFAGSFKPSQALTALNGSPAEGEWQLLAVDNAGNKVGQINCWSLSVTTTTATSPSGVILTPHFSSPGPLRGTYNYVYLTIKNSTPNPLNNVTLTGTLPAGLTNIREDTIAFPNSCDLNVTTFTCTWSSIASGEGVAGGVLAQIANPKQGKLCLSGNITATGINTIKASQCFTTSAYPTPDNGTGYDVGDIAHNIRMQDQNGNPVALSDFAGSYVLLQFTAVWCGPSNFEVPQDRDEIADLNASNAMGVPVVFLSVLVDGPTPGVASTQQNATNWVNHFNLTSPVLFTANDTNRSANQQHLTYDLVGGGMEQAAVPTSIFIRPNGTIFGVRVGVEPSGGTTDRFLNDLP
jgi:subtilisin-like proprotein convertase family protein